MTINKETHKKTYTGMCGAGMERGQTEVFHCSFFCNCFIYVLCMYMSLKRAVGTPVLSELRVTLFS